MTLYPNVQTKGQREIEELLGGNRLPEMGDRESLPYVNRILKEVLRWRMIAPLGMSIIQFYLALAQTTHGFEP